jgi:hypothetical protein
VHRGHGGLDIVFEALFHSAGESRQHEHGFEVLAVEHLQPGIAVLVFGMLGEPVDLHQRSGIDTLGDLAAEQQIQAARLDDRVEGRVGDEVVDRPAEHRQRPLAVLHHLHTTAPEFLG